MSTTQIYLGSDHGGFGLKSALLPRLKESFPKLSFEDLGCHSTESVNYPEFAKAVAQKVAQNPNSKGLLFCGSGIGVAISANKVQGIRAATLWDETSARLSRQHNDCNIACLGERLIGAETAFAICKVWLETGFEGGRHQKRVDLITALEQS